MNHDIQRYTQSDTIHIIVCQSIIWYYMPLLCVFQLIVWHVMILLIFIGKLEPVDSEVGRPLASGMRVCTSCVVIGSSLGPTNSRSWFVVWSSRRSPRWAKWSPVFSPVMCDHGPCWKRNCANLLRCRGNRSWWWWCIAMKVGRFSLIGTASITRSWELRGSRHEATSSWFWHELNHKNLPICTTKICCAPCQFKEISLPWAHWVMLAVFWLGEIPLQLNNFNRSWSSWPRLIFMSLSMLQASRKIGTSLVPRHLHGAHSCNFSFTHARRASKREQKKAKWRSYHHVGHQTVTAAEKTSANAKNAWGPLRRAISCRDM